MGGYSQRGQVVQVVLHCLSSHEHPAGRDTEREGEGVIERERESERERKKNIALHTGNLATVQAEMICCCYYHY